MMKAHNFSLEQAYKRQVLTMLYLRPSIFVLAMLTTMGGVEVVEAASTPSPGEYQAIDGSNNNLDRPSEGQAGNLLRRNLDAHYDWVIGGGNNLKNPRNISNILSNSNNPPKDAQINLLETFFGQFVNHDKEETRASNTDFYSISLPPGDILTRPSSLNSLLVGKGDLVQNAGGGNDLINYATGWLDLSTVYGSSNDVMYGLRVGSDGNLRTSNYNVGPFTYSNELCSSADCPNLPRDPTFVTAPAAAVVVAGDVRVGENVALTINHTLFHREHNRLAGLLKGHTQIGTMNSFFRRRANSISPNINGLFFKNTYPSYFGA